MTEMPKSQTLAHGIPSAQPLITLSPAQSKNLRQAQSHETLRPKETRRLPLGLGNPKHQIVTPKLIQMTKMLKFHTSARRIPSVQVAPSRHRPRTRKTCAERRGGIWLWT